MGDTARPARDRVVRGVVEAYEFAGFDHRAEYGIVVAERSPPRSTYGEERR
jgi:hypothetical protein